ncbi:encapsulin-associated ferritin-like protein [Fusobacterium sp. MFO224]|uniref:encapsulin-associated ferritin-like protein n=1 Tax=Fusobacterium sp. MFO224 TaxID=3378070 RepID=UPI003854059D
MPQYHEANLSSKVKDQSRALNSLKEEIEAIDWYNQRADVCEDPELKAILEHNRDEETEHAVMLFEWLRRNMPAFEKESAEYLFTKGSLLDLEENTGKDTTEKKENSDNIFLK